MTRIHRRTLVRAAPAAVFCIPRYAHAAKTTLKLATLAPAGSSWMNTFQAFARNIKKETGGELALRLYGGGVMGDEGATVRKMRTGQLDGAALTSVGLAAVNKQLLMLQLPLLFQNYEQLDTVRSKMSGRFAKMISDAGMMHLGWGDVGFSYVFANRPVPAPSALSGTRMWVWDADPVMRETMKVAGAGAVPLAVPDVLPSLSTGVVDAFTNSPYGAIALQWHTKATHVTNLRLGVVIGGSVITKAAWAKIDPKHHELLRHLSDVEHAKLIKRIRADNQKAIGTLTSGGMKTVNAAPFSAWRGVADKVRKNLTGSVFDSALVAEMLAAL